MVKRRYVHSKTTGEHLGFNYEILEDGKVKLTNEKVNSEVYDEIIVPASLIFKVAKILEATRSVVWMPDSEVDNGR